MPSERPIAPRIVVISSSDFLPKFFVLSSSASVLGTSSAMVRMFALLRQFDARTESSSSSTLRGDRERDEDADQHQSARPPSAEEKRHARARDRGPDRREADVA